nr:MAG: hypothetical protein [Bacteriophage sp.]
MDVDAMDELMYDTLIRYFKTLAHTGYKSYDVVFKMLVMDFIYEITHTELRYYITNKDIKLMQDLLYQLFGSTCEISFPTNNRPCCVCVCCNGEGTTPPPVVVPTTTTTSTQPPIEPTYLILSSTVANTAYVDYELVEMWTPIKVEVGSRVTIMAQNVSGYTFNGFYVAGSLISSNNTLQYTIPSTGTNTIELRYKEEEGSNNVYYGVVEDYMSPFDFVDTPIDTLMKRGGTKSKAITGTKVNEFAIPQNGYYTYLIVPVDKVELQYAAFTSGGITTVCYDRTKENIPNDTNNGIFFSKYTRGGVNANQGGAYNGINYDVYFVYNNYGGAPELINVKAKNK